MSLGFPAVLLALIVNSLIMQSGMGSARDPLFYTMEFTFSNSFKSNIPGWLPCCDLSAAGMSIVSID